jgi:hypothetical protein
MTVRNALIGFMAATAQAQAEATKAAQKAESPHSHGRSSPQRDMLGKGAVNIARIAKAPG